MWCAAMTGSISSTNGCDIISAMEFAAIDFETTGYENGGTNEPWQLGDLCEMFGLVPQIEGRTWHDGLYDAIACANLANFLSI